MVSVVSTILLLLMQIAYFKIDTSFNIIDKPNKRSSHRRIAIRDDGIIFPVSIILWSLFTGVSLNPFVIGLYLISMISFLDDYFTPEDKDDFLLKLNKIYNNSNQEHNCYFEGLGNLAQDFNRKNLAHKMLNMIKFI